MSILVPLLVCSLALLIVSIVMLSLGSGRDSPDCDDKCKNNKSTLTAVGATLLSLSMIGLASCGYIVWQQHVRREFARNQMRRYS